MNGAATKPAGHAILGVGTATFIAQYGLPSTAWQRPDTSLLRHAIDRGVQYLDTAASYGDGELAIGEISGMLRGVRLCTKVEVAPDASSAEIVRSVEASLARLGRSSIDTVMAHSAGRAVLQNAALGAAWTDITSRGLAARTGASTYGVDDARLALGLEHCKAVQIEYSILNQEVGRAAVAMKRPGQEVVVRSVLCKGLLTTRRGAAPEDARAVTSTIDRIDTLAREWGFTLPALAIRFALDTPGVDVVLVGVGTVEELETALSAASRAPLDAAQMEILTGCDCSTLDSVHPERWGRIAVQ